MSANEFITISDLAKELGVDDSSVRFYLGRFAQHLPDMADKSREAYPKDILNDLMFITEKMHSGHRPSEIEQKLSEKKKSPLKPDAGNPETDREPLNFLAPLLEKIIVQQERIASAHEQRAETEARKARAIEKRAEAETHKAAAMNNIASALQHMKHEVFPGSPAGNLISAAQKAIAHEHNQDQDQDLKPEKKHDSSEDQYIPDDMDDLSQLTDETTDETTRENLENKPHDFSRSNHENQDLDDLSLLIDEAADEPAHENQKKQADDLSRSTPENQDLDDLSLLIGEAADKTDHENQEIQALDNLSLLLDETTNENQNIDDLSLLIDETTGQTDKKDISPKRIKTSVTPENDFKKYKSEIINHIIRLKKEGLSIDDTTALFNEEKVKTLSGKDQWSKKAIAKIFKLIDSVSKKN